MLDSNQDGMVNSEELRDMLSRLGFKDVINDTLITSLINDATRNGKLIHSIDKMQCRNELKFDLMRSYGFHTHTCWIELS